MNERSFRQRSNQLNQKIAQLKANTSTIILHTIFSMQNRYTIELYVRVATQIQYLKMYQFLSVD